MTQTTLAPPLRLDRCDPQALLAYYQRAWALEDRLWQSLVGDGPFYLNPDPLRNLLIFYPAILILAKSYSKARNKGRVMPSERPKRARAVERTRFV